MSDKPACNATGKQTSFLVYREQWVTVCAQITYTQGLSYGYCNW